MLTKQKMLITASACLAGSLLGAPVAGASTTTTNAGVSATRAQDAPRPHNLPSAWHIVQPDGVHPDVVTRVWQSDWNGKCLDADRTNTGNGAKVQIWDCNGWSNQTWNMSYNGNVRAWQFKSAFTGKCMDGDVYHNTQNGDRVLMQPCNGLDQQYWIWAVDTQNNHAYFINVAADKVLDADRTNPGNGSRVQLWDRNGWSNQDWH
jgi:hypothetical protein